jgi:tetratricopeptide (TPR) repeat protein
MDPQAVFRLGVAQQAQRKFDAAVSSYEKSLSLRPGAVEPLTEIANVRIAQAKPDLAAQRIGKELSEHPKNLAAQVLLARIVDRMGKTVEAEDAFRKAVAMEPKVPVPYLELANFYRSHKNQAGEAEALKAGLAVQPGNTTLLLQLGDHYTRVGSVDQALSQYETVLNQQPGNDVAANNLASLLLDTRADQASADRALQLAGRFKGSPNLAYLDTYGWAGVRAGHLDEGVAALRQVVDKAPNIPVFQYHLGAGLQRKGDSQSALPLLRKAVSAPMDFPGKEDAKQLLVKS